MSGDSLKPPRTFDDWLPSDDDSSSASPRILPFPAASPGNSDSSVANTLKNANSSEGVSKAGLVSSCPPTVDSIEASSTEKHEPPSSLHASFVSANNIGSSPEVKKAIRTKMATEGLTKGMRNLKDFATQRKGSIGPLEPIYQEMPPPRTRLTRSGSLGEGFPMEAPNFGAPPMPPSSANLLAEVEKPSTPLPLIQISSQSRSHSVTNREAESKPSQTISPPLSPSSRQHASVKLHAHPLASSVTAPLPAVTAHVVASTPDVSSAGLNPDRDSPRVGGLDFEDDQRFRNSDTATNPTGTVADRRNSRRDSKRFSLGAADQMLISKTGQEMSRAEAIASLKEKPLSRSEDSHKDKRVKELALSEGGQSGRVIDINNSARAKTGTSPMKLSVPKLTADEIAALINESSRLHIDANAPPEAQKFAKQIEELSAKKKEAAQREDYELALFYRRQIESARKEIAIITHRSMSARGSGIGGDGSGASRARHKLALYGKSMRTVREALQITEEQLRSLNEEDLGWMSRPRITSDWPVIDKASLGYRNTDLIDPQMYNAEFGKKNATWELIVGVAPLEDDASKIVPHYSIHFVGKPHTNYIGANEDLGPVIISIADTPNAKNLRTFIRSKKGEFRTFVPAKNKGKSLENLPDIGANIKLTKIADPSLVTALCDYETKLIERRHKFGLLYCREGQEEEDQWYNNVEVSKDYEDFLSVLGEKIVLQGWTKFTGGLNTKNNFTGTHSVYTTFNELEIMWHVSTLLPFFPDDPQQVERKRHLGNDVCILLFRDEKCTTPFDPTKMRSQFNHIFCVVQPDRSDGSLKYRIAFVNKLGVAPYGPPLPAGGIFEFGAGVTSVTPERAKVLREFLVAKLINGERSAMFAPDFKGKNMQTRKAFLTHLIKPYDKKKEAGK